MADLLSLKDMSPIEISVILSQGGWQICYQINTKALISYILFILILFIIPTVNTDQPPVPIDTDLNISKGLLLADPDFR